METVSSFVSEEENNTQDENKDDVNTTAEAVVVAEENEESARGNDTTLEDDYTTEGMPHNTENLLDGNSTDDRKAAMDESFDNEPNAKSYKNAQPKELVEQGISFLSGLAETLKSPEATAALVDSITEKDENTGETSIKIPVESKETVKNLFNLIGKLFAK